MLQITTSKKESVSRTSANLVLADTYIASHLELTLVKTQSNGKTLRKIVFVFKDYEYTVCFFDEETGARKTITGEIESINGDNSCPGNQYIVLRCLPETGKKSTEEKTIRSGMPSCGCFLNTSSANKYQGLVFHTIPIRNIVDMSYASSKQPGPPDPGCCDKDKEAKVVLIGISADVVKAVVVNLKLLMDDKEGSVKDITLKLGNDYTIAYYNSNEKTMYEFDGQLVSIRPIDKRPPKASPVRISEQVGIGDSVYNTKCGCGSTDKDDFLTRDDQECNDVELKFDTADFNFGTGETILLSQIRDCTLIRDNSIPTPTPEPDEPETPSCNCNNCNYKNQEVKMNSGDMEVLIDFKDKVVNYKNDPADEVPTGTISLQELVDFYFGN